MAATEITLITGDRHVVEGSPEDVQKSILRAARGSLMELAWLTETGSGQPIALNPAHLVALRASEG